MYLYVLNIFQWIYYLKYEVGKKKCLKLNVLNFKSRYFEKVFKIRI